MQIVNCSLYFDLLVVFVALPAAPRWRGQRCRIFARVLFRARLERPHGWIDPNRDQRSAFLDAVREEDVEVVKISPKSPNILQVTLRIRFAA